MREIERPLLIGNKVIKNRMCIPAMVCGGYSAFDGFASEKNVEHYRAFARGKACLIIQEAASIDAKGKVTSDQLGIWSDDYIEGLSAIAQAVHEEEGVLIAQICHGGIVAVDDVTYGPSAYRCMKNGIQKNGVELTIEQIHLIQQKFVAAALRIWKAGYDGVELHGCHRYLISQFLNTRVNVRKDQYGNNPLLFLQEIIREIKDRLKKVGNTRDFLIGVRLGGFEPTLEQSIFYAKELEKEGIDYLNISYGCSGEFQVQLQEGYPFKDIIYAADQISQSVKLPVFAVNGIRRLEEAEDILRMTQISMVNIGRAALVNPNWYTDALKNCDTGRCYECKVCFWHTHPEKCPGRKMLNKNKESLC